MRFPLETNIDKSMSWICIKWKFRVEDNRVVCITWNDNESWTEIGSKREWKEIIQQIYKIPVLEDNKGFLCRLMVSVPKKKGLISRLEM